MVGILGLEASVLKTVTLASDPYTPSLTPMHFEAMPIVRVALEASNIRDMPALKEGMRLLSLADPCVEVGLNYKNLSGLGEKIYICIGGMTTSLAK